MDDTLPGSSESRIVEVVYSKYAASGLFSKSRQSPRMMSHLYGISKCKDRLSLMVLSSESVAVLDSSLDTLLD
jgi:hypothetical protein